MLLVVVLECNGEIARSRGRIRLRHEGDIVTLHRLHEAFRHTVTLRAADRRGQRFQSNRCREAASLVSGAGAPAAVVSGRKTGNGAYPLL